MNRLIVLALVLLATPTATAAGVLVQVDRPSIDFDVARTAFAQAQAAARADGGALWGVSMDLPILFVDPDTRAVAANRGDAQGLLTERDGVWSGTYPADLAIANFMTDWAGVRWTMLMWPPPTEPVARVRLLMHESFHNIQGQLGISLLSSPCAHLATYAGRLWLRLEARALAAALTAEAGDGVREDAVSDALLLRAMRRSLFPGSGDAEEALERAEGSAEYTGVRLCAPTDRARADLIVTTLTRLAERETLTRSFPYATGPALSLLMDGYDPHWREDYLAGRSLTELLAPVVAFEPPTDPEDTARHCADRYGYDEVAAEESKREQLRQLRITVLRQRFVDGPVLILRGRTPNTSFDPNRIEIIDGVGLAYGTYWVSDAWGIANAPGGALVCADLRMHLPAPFEVEGSKLSGTGWTLDLAPGWEIAPGPRDGDFELVEGSAVQESANEQLHDTIVALDARFFDAYNICDLDTQGSLLSEDLEFFHDQGGLTTSKADLLFAIEENICGKVTRELVPGSIEVHPIPGYGAVEMGLHMFRSSENPPGTIPRPAKFVMIWRQENEDWRITRVISLHAPPEDL
ncbi:MAG: hypothetical protein ACI8Y8_000245 [Planctomycetota bacterium]